jgi:hypothetical protein
LSVTFPMDSPESLEEKVTGWPANGWLWSSNSLAVAMVVETPSAGMVVCDTLTVIFVGMPEACAADGSRQQPASAAMTLNRIVVRLLILRRQQHGTAATKRFLILTGYPASP